MEGFASFHHPLLLMGLAEARQCKMKKTALFSFHCSHLALTFDKLGCGSAMEMKKTALFSFHCSHLALTLLREVRLRLGNGKKKLRCFLSIALTLH